GAEGVGMATTSSVVKSFIMIIAADCFFTALFYFIFP
ncbi:MAG: ABC transporter permease, partial [Candidatus Omnitrophota bacterium]